MAGSVSAQLSSNTRVVSSSIDDLCPATNETTYDNSYMQTLPSISTNEIPCGQKSPTWTNQRDSMLSSASRNRNNVSTDSLLQLLETPTNGYNQRPPSQQNSALQYKRATLPPINPTLDSMGRRTVILIRIEDDAENNIITNPLAINRLIQNSNFNQLDIKDVRVNKNKKLIAIENKTELLDCETQELTKITRLGNIKVSCYIPNSDRYMYGVIGPISLDSDLEELKQEISTDDEFTVIKLTRLKKKINNTWVDSSSVKLTLETKKLPQNIKISYINFKVRPFIQSPMQCFKCQRLGHTAKSCTSKTIRCMLCGGGHDKSACESQIRFCSNCKGDHSANSNQCPYITQAKQIEKLKAKGINHNIARENLDTIELQSTNNDTIISGTYAEAVRNHISSNQTYDENNNRNCADSSTQTDSCYGQEQLDKDKIFLEKLRNFVLELMEINVKNETRKSKILLADGAIRNHFGIDLRETEKAEDTLDVAENKETTERKRILENTSCEEDILSHSESEPTEKEDNIWETVEKTVVKKPNKSLTTRKSNRKKQKRDQKGTKHGRE